MTQIGAIDPTVLLLIVQLAIAFFVLFGIQRIVRNFLLFLQFKFNERIAIGTSIKIDNEIYKVNKVTLFRIELENDTSYLHISISRWPYINFKILKYDV